MLHRFFHFLKQSLLVVLCILLLGGLLAGGWFFYQGRQLYRSAASSYPVASMYDTICARGSYTSYDALPQIYINAVICTEDEHFMTHKGIDPGAIARALLLDPAFIVADEPVSALDVSVQAQILNLLMDLRETFSLTMLFISHEMTVVRHLCDQVAVMYLGTVVEQADSEELFRNLLHPYTQSLMSAIPTLDPDHKKQRIVLQGDIPSAIDLPKGCPFADRCPQCQTQCKESRPPLRDVGGGHLVACHLV